MTKAFNNPILTSEEIVAIDLFNQNIMTYCDIEQTTVIGNYVMVFSACVLSYNNNNRLKNSHD